MVCCDLDALLLLEAQYQVSNMLLHAQEENTFETSENHRSGNKTKGGIRVILLSVCLINDLKLIFCIIFIWSELLHSHDRVKSH